MTDQTASDTDDTSEAGETTDADEAKGDDTDEAKADDTDEADAADEADEAEADDTDDAKDDDADAAKADGPSKAELDELGDKIHRVRSKAEESVEGVGDDQPSGPVATGDSADEGDEERPDEFHESGEAESSDDQTAAPPG